MTVPYIILCLMGSYYESESESLVLMHPDKHLLFLWWCKCSTNRAQGNLCKANVLLSVHCDMNLNDDRVSVARVKSLAPREMICLIFQDILVTGVINITTLHQYDTNDIYHFHKINYQVCLASSHWIKTRRYHCFS